MTDDPDEDDGQAAKQLTGRYRGLKPWKKGEASPNPGGRPRQHHEMVAKLRMSASEIVDELLSLAFKKKPTNSDKIRAGILRDVWGNDVRQATASRARCWWTRQWRLHPRRRHVWTH